MHYFLKHSFKLFYKNVSLFKSLKIAERHCSGWELDERMNKMINETKTNGISEETISDNEEEEEEEERFGF